MKNDSSLEDYWDFNEVLTGTSVLLGGMLVTTFGLLQILQNLFDGYGWGLFCLGSLLVCAGGKWLIWPRKFPANPAPRQMNEPSSPCND